ncbi:MAG: glycosyltransferase [Magnetospirillum sp.]|nr:glycosyltransferase [Magnetospirillum sp.]
MRVLFLHNAFPGQFGPMAMAMAADPANQVVFATAQEGGSLPGVRKLVYGGARPVTASIHPYLRWMEGAVLTGQAVYRLCHQLKQEGFVPDVVCAHSGWGPALYIKEVLPDCRLVGYFEWFYHGAGADTAFVGHQLSPDDRCRVATRNAALLMDLAQCDAALTPTRFQRDQFPERLRPLFTVLHDGVDTDYYRPDPAARLPGLDGAAEIVTYATRGMEPYRGFPQFMHAVALLQRRRPGLHVVVAGDDSVHYGERLPEGDSWKRRMLAELPELDLDRLHFVGTLPAEQYRTLLQASSAHVYLTVPFVLSWSLMDALACGCAIVGSDTAPVREVIEDNVNGLLVGFHSAPAIAERVEAVLDDRALAARLGKAARETAQTHYARACLLPRQLEVLAPR